MIEEPPVPAPEAPPPAEGRLHAFVARWCERPLRAAWGGLSGAAAVAWPGLALGAMAGFLGFCGFLGSQLRTGLTLVPDILLALLLGGLILLTTGATVLLLRLCLKAWPWRFCFGALGALAGLTGLLLVSGLPGPQALLLAAVPLVLAGGAGGAVAALLASRKAGWRPVLASALALLVVLGLGTGLVLKLAGRGSDPELLPVPKAATAELIKAADPGQPGLWKTASLRYGSGIDKRRKDFGPSVALKTAPVDASRLLPGFKGFKAKIRKWYWGFGKDALPRNGRVTYPEGKGPFPLVLAVHGNHSAQDFSDGGYQYLGELLASRGFIFVSVDENFLNGAFEGGIDKENAARGWLLLKHLELWRAWNGQAGNPFQGKVDLGSIALIGHSRGGEAVALAAAFNRLPCFPDDGTLAFDFGFGIQAVAAIAPIDGQYDPGGLPIPVRDVDYFVMQGSHDSDVSMFAGYRPYSRATFTGAEPHFKAALWIYRANHGQFNTAWGRYDGPPPLSWLLSTGALLDGEDQRRIAKVYLSGFLEASLHGRTEYLPMFRDPASAAPWLPRDLYLAQFQDSAFRAVAASRDDLDLTRATLAGATLRGEHLAVWKAHTIEGRDEWPFRTRPVTLGWVAAPNNVPGYTITLPPLDWDLNTSARLVFSLADLDQDPDPEHPAPAGARRDPIDFTLELVTTDGTAARVPLSRIRPLQRAVRIRFTKWQGLDQALYKQAWEPVFQTFEVPLALFKEAAPAWSPRELKEIRLRFDRSPRGLLLLDQVGFEP